jgi:hypothetical protein
MDKISLGPTRPTFPTGAHICYVYNDEEERQQVIADFIRDGLAENELVGYFVNDISPQEMREHLASLGVVLPPGSPPAQLAMSEAIHTYCSGGCFEPDAMLKKVDDFYQRSAREGYRGARITGEMAWALQGIPGSERLVEYEDRLNLLVQKSPVTLICQYDANRFDGATIYEIMSVHPMMIVRGQVVRNPFYEPLPAEEHQETL